jgi:hypothetical protein
VYSSLSYKTVFLPCCCSQEREAFEKQQKAKKQYDKKAEKAAEKKAREMAIFSFQEDRADAAAKNQRKQQALKQQQLEAQEELAAEAAEAQERAQGCADAKATATQAAGS